VPSANQGAERLFLDKMKHLQRTTYFASIRQYGMYTAKYSNVLYSSVVERVKEKHVIDCVAASTVQCTLFPFSFFLLKQTVVESLVELLDVTNDT
jgi:hypothetical protein